MNLPLQHGPALHELRAMNEGLSRQVLQLYEETYHLRASRDQLIAAAKTLVAVIEPMEWETHILLEFPALKDAIANAERMP